MERVDRILQAESTITDPAEPKPVVFNEAIRLEKVSFRYAEEWVLRDVDLTIRKGQTVALVAFGLGEEHARGPHPSLLRCRRGAHHHRWHRYP